jgi:hypothetical protein
MIGVPLMEDGSPVDGVVLDRPSLNSAVVVDSSPVLSPIKLGERRAH